MENILLSNGVFYDKLETHKKGFQHFAFSVFIFNKKGEMLIQKRAKNKYHSGGLWSNACCSHFKSIEEFNNKNKTAINRTIEELGQDIFCIDNNNNKIINFVCQFDYCDDVGNNLIENEQDFIFVGFCNDKYDYNFNKEEVEYAKFINTNDFLIDINSNSKKYTKWLCKIVNEGVFDKVIEILKSL